MTAATVAVAANHEGTRAGLSVGTLTASLLGLFAIDNLLLLHFWGLSLPLTAALMFAACSAITIFCGKFPASSSRIPYSTFAVALTIAVALCALGGEGRFFYANTDWQIRDSVLRDMATNPWPYAYDIDGKAWFLRAPLGMYLLPAMFGGHADMALLVSNALRLALLLTLACQLFDQKRERAVALTVFILFSGWDVIGTAIYSALGVHLSWDHIERWNFGYQYSSHITQVFWVPQHAIAGWTCALAFLLWRRGYVPVALFAAAIALVAIWSPLAIIGAVPFAALAGFETLRRRGFDLNDILLGAAALAIALPALLYLQIDAEKVGLHLRHPSSLVWLLCISLEVLPFAWPLLREREPTGDRPVLLLILALLLAMPLIQIGATADFQMRASIMPLALLAIFFAEWICRRLKDAAVRTAALAYALVVLALGAATPLLELRRAVVNGPSPRPLCSLIGVWHKQANQIVPYSSYLAPLSALPPSLRQMPAVAGRSDPDECWHRPWVIPDSPATPERSNNG